MRGRDIEKALIAARDFVETAGPIQRRLLRPTGGVQSHEIAMVEEKAMDLYDALKPLMRLYHDTTFAA